MKIVLLENIKKLGKKDEIVEVSDGYARNVLIAKGQALAATPENLNNVKLKNKNEEKKDENMRRLANEHKDILEKEIFKLGIKAGANGKTFGSVTSKEIAEVIEKSSKIAVDKKEILLDESIKNIGKYEIKVRLYKDIVAVLKLEVIES
ncbi:MAG: 50S ribosomal protein L9 [Lachnospiraceae bacterium]|nr:50S ribosomal protein L9 [Lachnospiraceae bacterium]